MPLNNHPVFQDFRELFESYHNDENREVWNNKVDLAEKCVQGGFNRNASPWLYTGRMVDRSDPENWQPNNELQVGFLSMNPRDGGDADQLIHEIHDFDQFLDYSDEGFSNYRNAGVDGRIKNASAVFKLCDDICFELSPQNPRVPSHHPDSHPNLNRIGFTIDWFPFRSKNFDLNLVNGYALNLIRNKISLLEEFDLPVVAIKSIEALNLLSIGNNPILQEITHNYNIPQIMVNGRNRADNIKVFRTPDGLKIISTRYYDHQHLNRNGNNQYNNYIRLIADLIQDRYLRP